VPSGLVQHEDGVGVRRQARGETVEELLHGGGRDLGQHQREALAGGGADGAEQEGPP
jgi:hypothetical protein